MQKHIFLFTLFFSYLCLQNSIAQNKNWNNIIAGGKNITAIAEDDNNIWAGTDIGLIKINKKDGNTVIFDKTSGLPGNFISAIAISKNGDIWFGLSIFELKEGCGLVKYDGSDFTIYNTSNSGLASDNISALCFDRKGDLWIGCLRGDYPDLVKFDGHDWTAYNSNNSSLSTRAIHSIAVDSTKLWIGTYGGLFSFDGDNWKSYPEVIKIINTVFVDNYNNKWIGMFNGIAKYNDSTWTIYSRDDPALQLYFNGVSTITLDRNNVLWAGTHSGLVKYDNDKWEIFTSKNSGLPANQVDKILTDKENNKWIGSYNGDNYGRLSKYDDYNWQNYKTWKGDLNSKYINFIEKKDSGNLHIGTMTGVNIVNGNKWDSFTWQDSLNYNSSYSFISSETDNCGNSWFVIKGDEPTGYGYYPINGILKYDGKSWVKYDHTNSDLPVCYINKIKYSANDNALWLATSIGAIKYDGKKWAVLDTLQYLIQSKWLTTMLIDGNVKWFGSSYYGLLRYDNSSWKLYNTSNSGLPDNNIRNLYIDKSGILWISTLNGLAKFDGNNWSAYNAGNSGLPSNTVTSVTTDLDNVCWIGTWNGLAEFDGINWKVYNTDNSPLLANKINCVEEDGSGNIWIACDYEGISVFNRNGLSAVHPDAKEIVPVNFTVLQNYPNPFNPSTIISYDLPTSSNVILKVYNILGKEVATLVGGNQQAGRHNVTFNTQNYALPSGVYVYRIQAGSFIGTKKMVLLK